MPSERTELNKRRRLLKHIKKFPLYRPCGWRVDVKGEQISLLRAGEMPAIAHKDGNTLRHNKLAQSSSHTP